MSRGTQVAPDAGGGFALFATAFEEIYNRAAPAAAQEQKEAGLLYGTEAAKASGPSVEVSQGYLGDPVVSSQAGKSLVEDASGAVVKPPFDFSKYATGGATRPDSFSGMTPEFRGGLSKLLSDAEQKFGKGAFKVHSGYRSPETQKMLWENALKKYGSAAAARASGSHRPATPSTTTGRPVI